MAAPQVTGSFRLFRVLGIDVYLHWMWFLLALFLYRAERGYQTQTWNLVELVAIFLIVLLHEYGHALACRSVGGRARHIVLWPLGGIAFVEPPQRPGPMLWSIVAGPLVNVALMPLLIAAYFLVRANQAALSPDLVNLAEQLAWINLIILCFNLLPIYPLDGGQILQCLLWFVLGRARSLFIAAGLGVVMAVAGGLFALYVGSIWLILIAVFAGMQSWQGIRVARMLAYTDRPEPI